MNKLTTTFVLLLLTMVTIPALSQQKEEFAVPLADFQGLYTMPMNGQEFFLEIKAAREALILIQKWDNKQITFDREGHLRFKSPIPPFSLEFRMNKDGKVIEMFAFGKDRWMLVDKTKSEELKEVAVSDKDLKKLTGYFKVTNDHVYVYFYPESKKLVARQLWDDRIHHLVATSPLEFVSRETGQKVTFQKKKDGSIDSAVLSNGASLERDKNYKPAK